MRKNKQSLKIVLFSSFFLCTFLLLPGCDDDDPTGPDPTPYPTYTPYPTPTPEPGSRFTDNGNGTITDSITGIMWTKNDNGNNVNWYQAETWCRMSNVGGYSDWVLPTWNQLETLYDQGQPRSGPCPGHPVSIPLIFNLTGCVAWTNETCETYNHMGFNFVAKQEWNCEGSSDSSDYRRCFAIRFP